MTARCFDNPSATLRQAQGESQDEAQHKKDAPYPLYANFDKLSAPRFDRLSAPRFDRLSAPRFDRLSAPRFDRLSAPLDDLNV
jgi:hypothetical protein